MKVDKLNWLILGQLQSNARASLTEIAKKVGLSSPSVAERIQKMEDAGIIDGYTAKLNMESLGYSLGVYISIKIRFGQVEKFTEYIKTVPEILECHKLTGNDCMLMKGYVRDPKHLEALNLKLAHYGELTTSLILSSIVDSKIYSTNF
ncbi:Lrp/AsnC family transcriptional regulator [Sungkyunkwania multivorans]|uniref:Lrp/AsnC family transcriptional regulator n=1 Tax=Sungkyunkwania multivorans TaxID=1173618 RepID=A0ABW3CXT3_9FLAO